MLSLLRELLATLFGCWLLAAVLWDRALRWLPAALLVTFVLNQLLLWAQPTATHAP